MTELSWHQMNGAGMLCKSWDIVGYTYRADVYCGDCTREITKRMLPEVGVATMYGDCGSAEELLGEWASAIGLDRDDERSYDSGDFPKVILRDSAHDVCSLANDYSPGQCGDRCGACGEPIGEGCPNIA